MNEKVAKDLIDYLSDKIEDDTSGTVITGNDSEFDVGISLPTKDLMRWNSDGDRMMSELTADGYNVDLRYASNDVSTQKAQIRDMIDSGCRVLIIASIDSVSLKDELDMAKEKGVVVIAYDRLIMESTSVDYYVSFDNFMVGVLQAEYIVNTYGIDNTKTTYNMEITAGDPDDPNARLFYEGAYSVLKPYIDSGRIVIVSDQTDFMDVATPVWNTEQAQARAENIIAAYYPMGSIIDAWLCSNDSTALGVTNALAARYYGPYPVVTGQDCDIANVKNIIKGKQAMSVFKDTRTLASQTVKMAEQILEGQDVDVNDTSTYNNGAKLVPSYLCDPIFVDANNYRTILIDSGYYTEDMLI
ncbi:MAG: sugar-binding protein [Clostridiales bacterium]|nr:sugar-binding protein [Clostridiales bacterium]